MTLNLEQTYTFGVEIGVKRLRHVVSVEIGVSWSELPGLKGVSNLT